MNIIPRHLSLATLTFGRPQQAFAHMQSLKSLAQTLLPTWILNPKTISEQPILILPLTLLCSEQRAERATSTVQGNHVMATEEAAALMRMFALFHCQVVPLKHTQNESYSRKLDAAALTSTHFWRQKPARCQLKLMVWRKAQLNSKKFISYVMKYKHFFKFPDLYYS